MILHHSLAGLEFESMLFIYTPAHEPGLKKALF